MKRIFTILTLALALVCGGGMNLYSQSKGKKKPHTHLVKKNQQGYADPTGHTYQLNDPDSNVILEFISADKVMTTFTVGEKMRTIELTWSQEEDEIKLPDLNSLTISKNGRTLTENGGKTFKLVK